MNDDVPQKTVDGEVCVNSGRPRNVSSEAVEPSGSGDADPHEAVGEKDVDGEPLAPPPPPQYGTILPAPISSGSLEAVVAHDPPRRRTGVLAMGLAIAAALGLGGFLLGRTDGGEETTGRDASLSPVPDKSAAVGGAQGVASPSPSAPTPEPAAAPKGPRCPESMVYVGGGKFFMGTDATDPVLESANPAHQVSVGPYCIDKTEVTVRAYRECSRIGECKRAFRDTWWPRGDRNEASWETDRSLHSALCNERYDTRDDHPINCVTWTQADRYCAWRDAALPSEAQWEYAARGTDGRTYPWGDDEPGSERLNGCGIECRTWRDDAGLEGTPVLYEEDDGFVATAPVGSFPAGTAAAGLVDMAGNVFEWTADRFEPYVTPRDGDGSGGKPRRVIRGGAFNSFMPQFADPAFRFGQEPDAYTHGIGFRCAARPNW
jgi:formylglycine-generating enzyme required for sulfatase activity